MRPAAECGLDCDYRARCKLRPVKTSVKNVPVRTSRESILAHRGGHCRELVLGMPPINAKC